MSRRLMTTNEELFRKNYGNFKAETTAINLFAKTFRINQGSKLDMRTIYREDYPKFETNSADRFARQRHENKNQKLLKQKIPMQTQTQSMIDFGYDRKEFQKALDLNKKYYPDLFRQSFPEDYYQRLRMRKYGRLSDISEEKENDLEEELRSKSQFNFGLDTHNKNNNKIKVNYIWSFKFFSNEFIFFFGIESLIR